MRKTRMILAVLVSVISLAAAAARAETITGGFQYADTGGLRPIAFAKVEIHRFAPRFCIDIPFVGRQCTAWSWGLDATTTTDGNGSISVSMPFAASGVVYGVKIFATNYAAEVWPDDVLHTVPFHREPGEPDGAIINLTASSPTDVLDFSYNFTEPWSAQHYNLAETVRHGFDYANARRDSNETDVVTQADVQPTPLTPGGSSWYNPVADTLVINSASTFNDFLILHEYAHFLEAHISSFAWIASDHSNPCIARDGFGNIINSAEHAWMEGFADYLAHSVDLFLPVGTLSGGLSMSKATLENQPTPCPGLPASFTGDTSELRVAATLWDLLDDPSDPGSGTEVHDLIRDQDVVIFEIVDRELDTFGTWPTISHFYQAWVGRGHDCQALQQIFVQHGIPVPSACPPLPPPSPL
jgi:hypothetical protein